MLQKIGVPQKVPQFLKKMLIVTDIISLSLVAFTLQETFFFFSVILIIMRVVITCNTVLNFI